MTNPTISADIRADLTETSLALRKARDDAALYERLKAAAVEVKRLEALGADLTAKLAAAVEAEDKQAKTAMFAKFDGIAVQAHDAKAPVNQAIYTIAYKKLAYDADLHESVWVNQSVNGFKALPTEAYRYLIEAHPEAIPAAIMALAPNDPNEAFRQYFNCLQRGYVLV